MTCPVCCANTTVVDTYPTEESVVRMRKCKDPKCNYTFRTVEYETAEDLPRRWQVKKRGEF